MLAGATSAVLVVGLGVTAAQALTPERQAPVLAPAAGPLVDVGVAVKTHELGAGAATMRTQALRQVAAPVARSVGDDRRVQPRKDVVAIALRFARKQIGEPYVLGAAGPTAWDCSGLTLKAFAKADVAIGGHGATVQYLTAKKRGQLVPYAKARPGDLLFWSGSGDMAHVAIYSGDGMMIEAARPGRPVREIPVRTDGLFGKVARVA